MFTQSGINNEMKMNEYYSALTVSRLPYFEMDT